MAPNRHYGVGVAPATAAGPLGGVSFAGTAVAGKPAAMALASSVALNGVPNAPPPATKSGKGPLPNIDVGTGAAVFVADGAPEVS